MEICRDCNSLDQTQKKQSEDVLPSMGLIYLSFIVKNKVLVTDTTERPQWEKDSKRLLDTNTPFQKTKRIHMLAQTESLVSWFQMLLHKDKLILKRWRQEKYYSKFNSFNAAPFNLFYCLKGGKGMFLTVCETSSSAKLMLMGILWPEPTRRCLRTLQLEIYLLTQKKIIIGTSEETAFALKTVVWNTTPIQPFENIKHLN